MIGRNEGSAKPIVRVITDLGDILIALEADRAPQTVTAFLAAVEAGDFDGGSFWRSVRSDNDQGSPTIEVIQANAARGLTFVEHERTSQTGLRHLHGTISLGRQSGSGGAAQSFFLCVGDQPGLDAGHSRVEDTEGFAAFGRVAEGMETVEAIHRMETSPHAPAPYLAGQMLGTPVVIHSIRRETADHGQRLARLADDYWSFRVREFPFEASAAGISEANSLVDGATPADFERRAAASRTMLDRAEGISTANLSQVEGVTLALLREQLELMLEGFRLAAPNRESLFPMGFFDLPSLLLKQTPLATFKQREAFAARLLGFPRYLRDNLALLKAGIRRGFRVPRVIVPRILVMLDDHLSPTGFLSDVTRAITPEIAGIDQQEIEGQRQRIAVAVRDHVIPALQEVQNAIAAMGDAELTEAIGVSDQPGGQDFYRFKIREQTSGRFEPEDLHKLGLDEVARIKDELSDVLRDAGWTQDARSVAAELDSRVNDDAEKLLNHTRAVAKRIDGLLPRLFGRFPRTTYAVESMTPESSKVLPPALAQPAPADRSMPGIFWLTALPEKCPTHLIIPLTLHEAWPGHLMQLSLAHELCELPSFRRFTWPFYNGYVEGWALYCERLGHDLGLYDSPEDHFGLLTFELWRAARLVVDTGIHWLGWTRAQAIDYMQANSFLPLATIESEVDRYIGMPAQALSYKVGERVIVRLRERAETALQGNFSLRAFHDFVLACGPVSLDILTEEGGRWIESELARTAPTTVMA